LEIRERIGEDKGLKYSRMIQLLPKIKGMPDDFNQKVEKRKEVFQDVSEEHSKFRCEFLTQKVKFDTLLDLSLATDDKDLQASLIISKETWTNQVQQTLLNGKKNGRLDIETADALKSLMFEKLTEESNHLLSHWNYGSDLIHSKQLPILIQGDLESITEVDKENGIDMKQLKHESRRKDLLQSHSQIAKELIHDHALGHVSILDKLQIEYISAKKRNLELKTKCKELEVMLKTYPPEANQALSKIQQEFTRKIDAEEKKSAQMRGELDQYEKLGQSFDNIAEKYAKVLQEIQHQTWMLDTINNENKNENS